MKYSTNTLTHAIKTLDPTSNWAYTHTAIEECPENEEMFKNLGYYDKNTNTYKHELLPFTWEEFKTQLALSKTALDWVDFREQRNKLLAETDWMASSDVTLSDAWKTYRQALRDLPANTSDPTNPIYPTKPE